MSFHLNSETKHRTLTKANYQHPNMAKAARLKARIAKLEEQGKALVSQYDELVTAAYKQYESSILGDFPAKCGVEVGKAYYATPTFEGKVLRVIIQGAKLYGGGWRVENEPVLVVAVIPRRGGGGISEVKELNPKAYTFIPAEEARPERLTKPPKPSYKKGKKDAKPERT